MLNPSVCKMVYVNVYTDGLSFMGTSIIKAIYKGMVLDIHESVRKARVKTGKRRLYLKFSIMSDSYYLTNCA